MKDGVINVRKEYKKIDKISKKIRRFQESCKHENKTEKHGGSTGGYEENEYWTEYTCTDCLKKWREYLD